MTPPVSDRARAERKLGWLLCTPAVVAMVAVTAYPIGYAAWLSMQRADLRFPNDNAFIGLRNYSDVLTSKVWWTDLSTTLIITVVSLAIELVIGMSVALVLHRAVFVRRTVRTSVLIPYGIITVVASLAWKYAFTPGTGFVNPLLGVSSDLLGSRVPSLIVIIMTEVWKTTPFMALLLLAGLALVPDE
ncbi:MAG: sugar ABC transporter permease, partial [Actinomycetota bacterium]|nr:sugar ABC transporter permease [Actinomycetota bacterium]